MPELPEVEVVRRGLADHVVGRRVATVDVLNDRAVRRHPGGAADLVGQLLGTTILSARRRGKYLWLPLGRHGEESGTALVAHLGMSGQLLVTRSGQPDESHLRVRFRFDDDGPELRFVDQRTFGGLAVAGLVAAGAGDLVPVPVEHIARDLLDPRFDQPAAVHRIRARSAEIKRVLLDQTVVSGVGNIYADEALWRASIHGSRPASRLTTRQVGSLLECARAVMVEALDEGGTSFDALYVDVNGRSGYFDRSLAAYGQEGRPCPRCGAAIRRTPFMNRSSFSCPRCQRAPRPRPAAER